MPLIQRARIPSIQFLPANLDGPPTIIFKWASNNNYIDPGGAGPLNLILPTNLNGPPTIILIQGPGTLNLLFAKQFKCITRVKLRVFILKVANSDPHVTFLRTSCNNQGRI